MVDKIRLIKKVMEKPEFRKLPIEDVEMAFSMCIDKGSDRHIVKCTRELLHKSYGAFGSRKLLVLRERDPEWVLRKHVSTRERLPYYKQLYGKLLKGNETVFDLGAGVNGFSSSFLKKNKYIGVEGIGQLVDLMNQYFKKQKLNARSHHLSLFELSKIKSLIKKERGKKVVFLFKVLDSLEVLERDFSKKLLLELVPLVDMVVASFATRSLISRKLFKAKRHWIIDFIKDNFKVVGDFELGSERYVVFRK